jgi:peptidyl-dipeptidase Dcp
MNYSFKNITIRTDLRPGDLGYVIHLHGSMYAQEYQYGISFETYVARGMYEFYSQYDAEKDNVWICEDEDRIIGFLLCMHRSEQIAQLRFFILLPGYRGMGLGKRLMELFMEYLHAKNYHSCYLWTTNQQATAAFIYKKLGFVMTKEKSSTDFGIQLLEQRYDLQLV